MAPYTALTISGNICLFTVGQLIAYKFLSLSLEAENGMSAVKDSLVNSKATRDAFTAFSAKCIDPLDVFIMPLENSKWRNLRILAMIFADHYQLKSISKEPHFVTDR